MASNAQKTPFARSLNVAAERRAREAIQLLGKALPASVVSVNGSIVTVSFQVNSAPWTLPQITCSLFGPEYIRYPIQPGCSGVVFPADCSLGGVNGLGSGTASVFNKPANLSALVFFPIGNANWPPPDDPDALCEYAPNGLIARDSDSNCILKVTPTGASITGPQGSLSTSGSLSAGNGASGTFTSADGKTVTVLKGIVTSIV